MTTVNTFESFQIRVLALISRVGGVSANFHEDAEKGKFYANCSDGTTIIGHPGSLRVTVRWGSGHTAQANI